MKAKLRDGTELEIGDEVETSWTVKCLGIIFVVFEIIPWETSESHTMVNVHVKGEPDRVLKSTTGLGLDANWFRKINNNIPPSTL